MQSPILAGLHPHSIKRRANHTYGIWTEPVFQEGRHPEHLRFVDSEGVSRCKAVFHKLIEKGQLLHQGQIFSATIPFTSWIMDNTLCRSPLKDPRYITDPDNKCKVVDTIDPVSYHYFDCGNEMAKTCDVLLIVGDIDVMFKVINRKTGHESVEYVSF
ncbi:uncharacterized protein LOC128223828 [Mya arenaria]|uniref:uncharacterized protein LOC128223828 n=1 Tax=Mya arenaria TaxID=6604 RepID=UPI0022E64BD1|nr:uncharacterized protein LOC128223828 [Mya arenaria]